MINTSNIEQARRLIKSEKKPVIVRSQGPEFDRKMLEAGKFDILLISLSNKKDSPKELNTGFNHVSAALCAKNKISLAVDLEDIRKLSKAEKARTLARLRSIIEVCRKENVKIKVLNIYTDQGASAFLLSLGASTQQSSQALTF